MKIVDCKWELENLGKRVCELTIGTDDSFNAHALKDLTDPYDYAVVKVMMNQPDFNFGLSKLGFTMVETQINISKRFKEFEFDDRLVKRMLPHVDEAVINTQDALNEVIAKITPKMFITDRIYIDPSFDALSSSNRYSNWMRTEFKNGTSIIKEFLYDGNAVGFGMHREKDGNLYGLLGGVYESEQNEGYGLLTACFDFLIAKKYNRPFIKSHTTISSNNVPMMQLYNYLHYKVDSMTYVFVKHNNIE